MKRMSLLLSLFIVCISSFSKERRAEDYYIDAYNEIGEMLTGDSLLSIKKAVFLAEWAYYEGRLNYATDFCEEIERIKNYVNLFYDVNNLRKYKTGKQIALTEYFFRPFSGNGYRPYLYDEESFINGDESWKSQFVSKTLKTHSGQCRSLPWMFKILSEEIGADVALARLPGHCYIMYKDEDNRTPEEWINLDITSQQMQPAWWIKEDSELRDSSIIVGTYMTPLTDEQTVACQLADLAHGYYMKFNRYDEFTLNSASLSLEYYPMNPIAIIIYGKSLTNLLEKHMMNNGFIYDEYAFYLSILIENATKKLERTYMKSLSTERLEHKRKQLIEHKNNIKN
ncbi:MAG: hypothetical protein K2H48_05560 [Duncaniella sp.]|nr:hypothetical protein [Duncaniella sp.]